MKTKSKASTRMKRRMSARAMDRRAARGMDYRENLKKAGHGLEGWSIAEQVGLTIKWKHLLKKTSSNSIGGYLIY